MATASVPKTFTNGLAMQASPVNTNFNQLTDFFNNQTVHLDGTKNLTADLDMGSNKVTNLATPTADADLATKGYRDSFSSSYPTAEYTQVWSSSRFYNGFSYQYKAFVDTPLAEVSDAIGLTLTPGSGFPSLSGNIEGFPAGRYAVYLTATRRPYTGTADGVLGSPTGMGSPYPTYYPGLTYQGIRQYYYGSASYPGGDMHILQYAGNQYSEIGAVSWGNDDDLARCMSYFNIRSDETFNDYVEPLVLARSASGGVGTDDKTYYDVTIKIWQIEISSSEVL